MCCGLESVCYTWGRRKPKILVPSAVVGEPVGLKLSAVHIGVLCTCPVIKLWIDLMNPLELALIVCETDGVVYL